jgi:hypothetical protein
VRPSSTVLPVKSPFFMHYVASPGPSFGSDYFRLPTIQKLSFDTVVFVDHQISIALKRCSAFCFL